MGEVLISQQRPAMRASATAAAGGANVSNVSVTVKSIDAQTTGVWNGMIYLSDAGSGAGLTAVTASGTTVAGASGTILGTDIVAKKAWNVQTTAAGLFILAITDAAKTPFVVCAVIEGRTYPILTMVAANYG